MKKFLLGILCGLVIAFLGAIVLSFAMVRLGTDRTPSIADGSTLMLKLEGEIAEVTPAEMPFPFLGGQTPPTVHEIWTALRAAAKDSRVKGIALMPRQVGAGWGKLDELRGAIKEFRKSGKPVTAWLRSPGAREYYLATAADKIYIVEEDILDLKGLRAEMTYFKGTLDKIGVQVEVEHIGKYKDAGDSYSRTSPTPESREVVGSILDGVFNQIIQSVAEGRKKTPEEIRTLIDDGPFLAKKALEAGLVDGLKYEDQFFDELKKGQSELKKLSLRSYIREAAGMQSGERVALITGAGAIMRGSGRSLGSEDSIFSEDFIKLLRDAGNDKSLRGAIIRVDSPGGDAIASDDILREMRLLSKKMPLVISMSDLAASGGYFIACTGDPIVAYPNTITGSIGVIYGKPNLKGLYDKIGVNKEIVVRGKNAAIDTDYGPMSPAARTKLKEGIQATYDGFVARVAEARRTTPAEIEPYAQGRAWLGSQGHANKLVDQLGGLDTAVALLKEKSKLGKESEVHLIPYPPRRSVWAQLLSNTPDTLLDSELRTWMKQNGLGSINPAILRGGMMRIMPYTLEIR